MNLDTYVREQVLNQTKGADDSALVTYRPVSFTTGTEPVSYPPTQTSFVTVGSASSTSTSIGLSASNVRGQIKVGDVLSFTGQTDSYTVTGGPYTASANAFAAVSFTPGLSAAVAVGVAVTLDPLTDVDVWARVGAFPRRLVDGTLVLASDLAVMIAASQLSAAPKQRDIIVIGGVQKSVIAYQPTYGAGAVAHYQIQAR